MGWMMTLGLILISLVVMCCSMSTLVLKLITRTFEFLLQKHKFSSFTKFKSSSESGLQQLPQLFCLPAKVPWHYCCLGLAPRLIWLTEMFIKVKQVLSWRCLTSDLGYLAVYHQHHDCLITTSTITASGVGEIMNHWVMGSLPLFSPIFK